MIYYFLTSVRKNGLAAIYPGPTEKSNPEKAFRFRFAGEEKTTDDSSKNHCFYKYTKVQNNCFQLHFCDSNSRRGSSSMLHLGSRGEFRFSPTERQEKIFHLINLNTKITREELAHEVGISLSGVDWNIRILKQRGLLNRFGSPRNGKWHPVTEYRM